MSSPRALARTAGLLYLIMAVCAGYAELFVRSRLITSGDATTTAAEIRAHATQFRVGFVVDLVQATVFVLTAMVLYLLLRHVNQAAAAAMVTFVAISTAVQSLNLLNQYTAWTIATSDGYTRSFGESGSAALIGLFADMQHNGFVIAQMFFGLWLLPLGYLVISSGYFPRVLGYLLIAAGAGYLLDLFVTFLSGRTAIVDGITGALGAVAELSFMGYLLIKGVRTGAQQARVPAMATAGPRP